MIRDALEKRAEPADKTGSGVRQQEQDDPALPDVIVTIGRRPTMAALWVRRRSGGRTRIILIGRQPRYLREFALVIASCQYVTADDPRIVRIALPLDDGLHRVNAPVDAAAAPPAGARAGTAEVAVLVGGPTRSFRLGVPEAREMLRLAALHAGDAPLRIVTSRRTPDVVCAWFAANLPPGSRLCAWQPGTHTTSDYAEALAQCGRFVVTGDSGRGVVQWDDVPAGRATVAKSSVR